MSFRWPSSAVLSVVLALMTARQSAAGCDIIIDDSDAFFTLFQGTLQTA